MQRRDPAQFIELYALLRKRLTALAAQAYATIDLGHLQARFLKRIGNGERISQAELARRTETDPTLTGRVLQTLIERGMVRRERSDEDRREYVIELDTEGKRMRNKVEKLNGELEAQLGRMLDERDLKDFERIVTKILEAIDEPRE